MSLKVQIFAPGKNAGKGNPERTVHEVAQAIAERISAEADELAKAGYTVDADSIRLGVSYGSYDVTMTASR